ncbi:MAG: ATPase [Clostridia bacterium]|nr:ATPase [Clostridia bacterium]
MKHLIDEGNIFIGIEFGSTRIKGVLCDQWGTVLATGGFNWENRLENGIWTYGSDQIFEGLQSCYADLLRNVKERYGTVIKKAKGIGISGMMHGYIALDKEKQVLAPFRTWRNNITQKEASKLTQLFQYNIPQRWSVAHLYQAVLNQESHLKQVDYVTTLAGYIHYLLTGEKVMGIGEASGMFPIDPKAKAFQQQMIEQFDTLMAGHDCDLKCADIFPKVLCAGEPAGFLTQEGASLLDTSGNLEAGIPLCPPEGDAGTGMVATNSVRAKTGNISAGTSAFAMLVLEKELSALHEEIDIVATPNGNLTAMAHSNNCTTEINAWVSLFGEVLSAFGHETDTGTLYETLFQKAEQGDFDCGDLLAYGFHSGEHLMNLSKGCPMLLHAPDASFNLANLMRVQIYTAFGALKTGLDILKNEEHVTAEVITGHGGIFKTKGVAQKILASAINTPVAVNETAGEGGAWGIAVLAAYLEKAKENLSLEDYLDDLMAKNSKVDVIAPDAEISKGFDAFMENYRKFLSAERECVSQM